MFGFLGNMISTGVNARIAQNNLNLQKENLAYQKQLQQQIFEREDNAVQRRVADLEAAGLSPTLASGQGAGAGQAISTQAPQNKFQMAMNLLPTVGSLADTFQKIYNAKWYAQAGLPVGYNPSDLGSAFVMSMLGGNSDRLVNNSAGSIVKLINLIKSGSSGDSGSGNNVGSLMDIIKGMFSGDSSSDVPSSGDSIVPTHTPRKGVQSDVDRLYAVLRSRYRESLSGSARERHIAWTRMYEDAYQYLAKKFPKKDSSALRSQAERLVHYAVNSKPSKHGMWRY